MRPWIRRMSPFLAGVALVLMVHGDYLAVASSSRSCSSSPTSATTGRFLFGHDPATERAARGRGGRAVSPDRPRYMISVAADLVGMHPQTLRLYENRRASCARRARRAARGCTPTATSSGCG